MPYLARVPQFDRSLLVRLAERGQSSRTLSARRDSSRGGLLRGAKFSRRGVQETVQHHSVLECRSLVLTGGDVAGVGRIELGELEHRGWQLRRWDAVVARRHWHLDQRLCVAAHTEDAVVVADVAERRCIQYALVGERWGLVHAKTRPSEAPQNADSQLPE